VLSIYRKSGSGELNIEATESQAQEYVDNLFSKVSMQMGNAKKSKIDSSDDDIPF
jgi:hypothetical protein